MFEVQFLEERKIRLPNNAPDARLVWAGSSGRFRNRSIDRKQRYLIVA